jgi:DNA polymerase V
MEYYTPVQLRPCRLPLATSRVAAGFPSPADDHLERMLDLNELLISNEPATFFVRAGGHSMNGKRSTIHDGDLLVVDKSLEAKNGDVVIACIDGQFTVKRLALRGGALWLLPENTAFPELKISEDDQDFAIWGVVTARISQFR